MPSTPLKWLLRMIFIIAGIIGFQLLLLAAPQLYLPRYADGIYHDNNVEMFLRALTGGLAGSYGTMNSDLVHIYDTAMVYALHAVSVPARHNDGQLD